MKLQSSIVFLLYFLLAFLSNISAQSEVSISDIPGTKEGVEELLQLIINSSEKERQDISQQLYPSLEDCEAVFDDRLAKKVYKYQRKIHRQIRVIIKPRLNDQTEILLWGVTTEELSEYAGDAKYFPGGYKELAQYFHPNQTIYRFKFIQPGRYLGSAYDILIHVNGHWKIIHRPWAVLFNW